MKLDEEKDKVFREYKNTVNMSANQLDIWSRTKCSKKASVSRKPVKRNLRLLRKNKSEWTKRDVEDAKRTINYLNRSSGISGGDIVKGCGLTKNQIARKNWGKDPNK